MNPMNIFLGFLPSFLWLNFYLREDAKPEPKYLILKIFFLGALVAFLAIFWEVFFLEILSFFSLSSFLFLFFKYFLVVALVEEFLKFSIVFLFIFDHPEFEEPVDGMIYMIVSALGFAATENILLSLPFKFFEAFQVSVLRFLGATFLHALCSAIFGYFVSIFYFKKRDLKFLFSGLSLSVILHGIYNFSIISLKEAWQMIFIFFFLVSLGILVSFLFKRLREQSK